MCDGLPTHHPLYWLTTAVAGVGELGAEQRCHPRQQRHQDVVVAVAVDAVAALVAALVAAAAAVVVQGGMVATATITAGTTITAATTTIATTLQH